MRCLIIDSGISIQNAPYYIVNFRSNISCQVEINMSIHLSIHQIAHSFWEIGDPGPDLAHPEDGVQECLGCETRGPVGLGLWAVSHSADSKELGLVMRYKWRQDRPNEKPTGRLG